MEEPGRLQSMGSLRVGHDWATSLSLFTFMHWRRKWQPTPVFLPGESQGRGSLVAAVYGVAQSRTRLKWLSSSSTIIDVNLFFIKLCIFPILLSYNWPTIPCKFRLYSIMVWITNIVMRNFRIHLLIASDSSISYSTVNRSHLVAHCSLALLPYNWRFVPLDQLSFILSPPL